MPNQIIDTKTETHVFKKLLFKETITTTGNLLAMSEGHAKFGLTYTASYSGIKNGQLSGDPVPVTGNGNFTEHDNPKVVMSISNFSDDGASASMHVMVTVDAHTAGLGTVTLFDQTLGGRYGNVSLSGVIHHAAASGEAMSE